MGDVLVGILLLLLGAGACLVGLMLFFFVLPVWGFITGFFVGAAGMEAIFGDGFLSTVSGWIVGFLVGVVFAIFSWLYWYVGTLLAAASLGALLASGLMSAFSIDNGFIVFIASLAGAIIFAWGAYVVALPVYVVVITTAMVGAFGVVAGLLLVFNQLDLDQMGYGAAWALIEDSWFWLLIWAVIAAVGLGAQLTQIQSIRLPDDRWIRAKPVGPAQPAA